MFAYVILFESTKHHRIISLTFNTLLPWDFFSWNNRNNIATTLKIHHNFNMFPCQDFFYEVKSEVLKNLKICISSMWNQSIFDNYLKYVWFIYIILNKSYATCAVCDLMSVIRTSVRTLVSKRVSGKQCHNFRTVIFLS